jgi:aminopeptidase-like protein
MSLSEQMGKDMYRCVVDLYPLCRSITGDGLRETLRRLQRLIPLTIHEVPTGTRIFDWTVPKEWNVRDAYVKNARGERVIDFRDSNLHVVSYSVPVRARMPLTQLREHLFTLPGHPEWIPYRTAYHEETWGFCLSHRTLLTLEEGEYEVCIDSTLAPGALSYGELYLEGQSSEEVLVSCHVCHPSLANDNLSAVALATYLARHLESEPRRYSYRFLFLPGTIGPIAWLARNEPRLPAIKHGLVLSSVGDAGPVTYKKARRAETEIDRAVAQALKDAGDPHEILGFSPYGDERQFCSIGIDLPVGCFSRTPHGRYPQYHTSADDLALVHEWALADSFAKCAEVLNIIEANRVYLNTNPKCEPHLGRRGLYRREAGRPHASARAMQWLLSLSDGAHSLLDVAQRSGQPFRAIQAAADALAGAGLLRERAG